MLYDHVVAVVDDTRLSSILPVVHRAGFGHVARALRASSRSDVIDLLRRAGVPVEQRPPALASAGLLLMIGAAARSKPASELLLQHGAIRVWIVTTDGFWREIDDEVAVAAVAVAATTAAESVSVPSAPVAVPPSTTAGSSAE